MSFKIPKTLFLGAFRLFNYYHITNKKVNTLHHLVQQISKIILIKSF